MAPSRSVAKVTAMNAGQLGSQSATTDLVFRNDHVVAGSREQSHRTPIHRSQHGIHDAASEKRDSPQSRSFSTEEAAGRYAILEVHIWSKLVDLGQRRCEPFQQPCRSHETLHPGLLVELHHSGCNAESLGVGKDSFEYQSCDRVRGLLRDDLSAHLFHHLSELDAGWARGLARTTVEASEHVFDERLGDLCPPFVERPHQVDAPTRRIHLAPEHTIGWTRRETQPAMHAVKIEFVFGFQVTFLSPST